MMHEFPELEYEYDSLEPYIDEETMKIHHDKHYKGYFDKFVKAIEGNEDLENMSIEEILSNLESVPEEIRQAVINNGGGFFHHSFFWKILKKRVSFDEKLEVGKAIIERFGGFDNFKKGFSDFASTLFGSGWVWLVVDKDSKELEIIQTSNQDSPLSLGKIPLLVIDVWEHAYYLKYQNRRVEYINNFFYIINWDKVNELFLEAKV
ncbi:MAG: superoxide dismutase [Candidatus Pacearchaeota archaeon]|nr:superoxide dismutase [Candidatus Pacearchaeota archaeon]